MLPIILAFVVGIACTLFSFSVRPPVLVRRLAAFWVPLADTSLRTLALGAFVGAGLTAAGFWEGQRYMALPPADMRAVANAMDRSTASMVILERSVSDFSTEVDDLLRHAQAVPVVSPLPVTLKDTDP